MSISTQMRSRKFNDNICETSKDFLHRSFSLKKSQRSFFSHIFEYLACIIRSGGLWINSTDRKEQNVSKYLRRGNEFVLCTIRCLQAVYWILQIMFYPTKRAFDWESEIFFVGYSGTQCAPLPEQLSMYSTRTVIYSKRNPAFGWYWKIILESRIRNILNPWR